MLFKLFVATMALNSKLSFRKLLSWFGSWTSILFSLCGLSEWCGWEEKSFPLWDGSDDAQRAYDSEEILSWVREYCMPCWEPDFQCPSFLMRVLRSVSKQSLLAFWILEVIFCAQSSLRVRFSELIFLQCVGSSRCLVTSVLAELWKWHRRLGHLIFVDQERPSGRWMTAP
jgi:hypothetical protein